jgi:cytochrome bd ubiquinol oxidase subunit I
MFGLTALELARIQFGFTVSFHIIFPAITIGLASYLAVLEGLWLWKKDTVYRDLYHFWSKIFAVNFAMGVVSGLVMAYQFGTNWSYFSAFAGSITGPLLAYEVLTAFFLEAGFLCPETGYVDADCSDRIAQTLADGAGHTFLNVSRA